MRELQLYPAKKRRLPDIVRTLRFVAGGSELVAWVNEKGRRIGRVDYYVPVLYSCDVASGASRQAELSEWMQEFCIGEPAWSSDGRYIAVEVETYDDESLLAVQDWHSPDEALPYIPTLPVEDDGLFFTPDGGELIALQYRYKGRRCTRGVARFDLDQLRRPPVRFEEQLNRFTGEMMKVPVRNLKWKTLIAGANWKGVAAASLSADGRFLAVADEDGKTHVADLKKKRVTAKFQPEGKTKRDRAVTRIDFDPKAEWVVRLAGGKLFAQPLAEGEPWRTKPALGSATGFAFHPHGRVLCAVFADGSAKYLDPRTGAVRQSFKWGKKPLHSVAFSPDGLTCAAGGENGRVVVWDVDA
jgi:hypothetical protein